jgi:8-oxo-dGTP pyrophosphatase MutT (NUDIX family)
LQRFGYRVERQPFEFSTAPTVFISLEVLACLVLILAALGARAVAVWAPAVPAVLLLLFLLLTGLFNHAVEAGSLAPEPGRTISPWLALCLRLGSRYTTANLVATWPDLAGNTALPQLYLVAHYDSKSQRMPLAVRVTLFTTALAGGLTFAGTTLLGLVFPGLMPVATVVGIVAIVAGVPLMFLDTGNTSPGAIDNASGVGVVLHLAECLAERPELRERLRPTILITSAEEMTLMGAVAHLRREERRLLHQAEAGGLYILNFDGTGVDGKLYLVGGKENRLGTLIREAAQEVGVSVGRFSLFGALFDHVPFAQCGLEAVSLIALGRATWAVHTPGDSADKLHVRGFEQAGQVALRAIEKIT